MPLNPALIFAEAKALFGALKPLDQLGPERSKEILGDVLFDIATIAAACGLADQGMDEAERATIALFLRFPFLDDYEKRELEAWRLLSAERKAQLLQDVKAALSKVPRHLPDHLPSLEAIARVAGILGKPELLASYSSHLYRFAQLVARAQGGISDAEIEVLEQIWELISSDRHSLAKEAEFSQNVRQTNGQRAGGFSAPPARSVVPQKQPIEEVLEELDQLIGLTAVKQEVRALVDLLQVQRARVSHGLKDAKVSLHAVFVGPPGTGKTTVARLYGRILHSLGFLKKGQLIETDRAGLVAEYVGQTGPKVDSVVKSAEGGVLFIDEAYALRREGNQGDFGQEAIETLLKRMEDKRDSFVVIVAGYEDEMKQFLAMNPGLSSRFPTTVKFPHYECDELERIFQLFVTQADYVLSEGAQQKVKELCARASEKANRSFGNARAMRNRFEAALRTHAVRICRIETPSKVDLETLEPEDISD